MVQKLKGRLSQTTAEFAGNFELNPVKGVFEKVGLKFGASAKKDNYDYI